MFRSPKRPFVVTVRYWDGEKSVIQSVTLKARSFSGAALAALNGYPEELFGRSARVIEITDVWAMR